MSPPVIFNDSMVKSLLANALKSSLAKLLMLKLPPFCISAVSVLTFNSKNKSSPAFTSKLLAVINWLMASVPSASKERSPPIISLPPFKLSRPTSSWGSIVISLSALKLIVFPS